jgi:hypothetical protein
MSKRISTEELIQELNRLNRAIDGSPTQKNMNETGQYSITPYIDRFGSWTESLQEAGISPDRTYATKKELIEELERIHEISSGSPTKKEMNEVGEYSAQTYHRRFGSWNDALEEAGLSENRGQYTKKELLDELRRLDDELDHPATQSDMSDQGEYYPEYYKREFGSWNEAKAAAGIEAIEPGGKSHKVSADDLIAELNRLDEETDGSPTKEEMQRVGEYSHQVYRHRFGTWNKTLEEAGIEKNRNIDEQKLLDELHRLDEKLDYPVSQSDVDQHSRFSHQLYVRNFGSFNIAKQKAGVETRRPGFVGTGEDHPSWKGGYEHYYGPSWPSQRRKVLERDGYKCVSCGMTHDEHLKKYGAGLEVHHRQPFREFGLERHEEANQLDNLVTLCKSHHKQWEHLPVQPELPD